jgi:beta-mannosidase
MARLIRDAAPLDGAWEVAGLGRRATASSPAELGAFSPRFRPANVPGTVAAALQSQGELDLDHLPDLDAQEWWYRCRFHAERGPHVLRFQGLATLADVFIDGDHVLSSSSMFLENEVRRTVGPESEIWIRFRSLEAFLAEKRPRPRYKTRLVSHQQLRWVRTTLLGRMPGFAPRLAPVGPFRPVLLERMSAVRIVSAHVTTTLDGRDGLVHVAAVADVETGVVPDSCSLVVGSERARLECRAIGPGRFALQGTARIRDVGIFWPHTHGQQPLYPAHLSVVTRSGETSAGLGRLGFRTIEILNDPSRFELLVNGQRIFCRGVVWTTTDLRTLGAAPDDCRRVLGALKAAGMNMVRIPGTMFYESDDFYDACDELGILVWQDFMFANMDYPFADAAFVATVREEAAQTLSRLETHPSVAVLCGGSEVGQQAAMLGLPRDQWYGDLFERALLDLARAACPGVPYVVNSPCGEPMPFTPSRGAAHYYGVGAYLRPLSDARLAEVKFASECLAFANVPDADILEELDIGRASVSHPRWKARVPRDAGAAWDFDDVRDYYFEKLYRKSPVEVRYADPERYLDMSRLLTGEVMASVFSEWRRHGSTTSGGLILCGQDLWPGAGFGVLDARGRPKAALRVLARALAPTALLAIDEGLGGLVLHAVHDGPEPLEAVLTVSLYREDAEVGGGERRLVVPARGSVAVSVEELLGRFADTTYAYRFGPPGHDSVAASLVHDGKTIASAIFFPLGYPTVNRGDLGLSADLSSGENGRFGLRVSTRRLAFGVHMDVPGYLPDDDWFHLPPGGERTIQLVTTGRGGDEKPPRGRVAALNGSVDVAIRAPG